jgi:alpha-glucosidase
MLAATTAFPQTLARPGWTGSGFNADPWWKHAIFYNAGTTDPANSAATTSADLKAITAKLDALRSLGVDALILPPLPLPALPAQPAAQRAPAATPDAAALDDFDELIHQAARRNIRVLLTLYATAAYADLSVPAHFWLSRGVSGFRLTTAPPVSTQDTQAIVQSLRRITSSAVGGRIVISDFSPAAAPTSPRTPTPSSSYRRTSRYSDSTTAQLQIDSHLDHLPSLDAENVRPLLAQSLLTPDLLLDFSSPLAATSAHSDQSPATHPSLAKTDSSVERARAAILLTTHSAALIGANATAGPAPGPTAGTVASYHAGNNTIGDWYRQLSMMHRGNSTLRTGSVSLLDFDAQNALVWVIRPVTITSLTPPIVVACNLSGSPLHLSLTTPLKALDLRGIFLRTLLRTDDAMGGQDLDYVNLPPYAVYIGELRR